MSIDGVKKAWQSKLISDVTTIELSQRLSLIYFAIGLRMVNYPNKKEDLVIHTYLRRKYGHRTIDELYLAFDLAINDRLDVDGKVYDQFSLEYISRIMNAYGRYVFKLMKDLKTNKEQIQSAPITEEEKRADIQEYFEAEEVKVVPLYLYDWMDQLGFLQYTDAEKVRNYNKAIKQRQHDLEVSCLRDMGDKNAKGDLERLKENIRQGFRNATSRELSAIQTEYKKIILLDQKQKRKK